MKYFLYLSIHFLLAASIASCAKGSAEEDNTEQPNGQPVTKNVLLLEFVSFDCVYCPAVTRAMEDVIKNKYPGRIDVISVHGRLEETDPMEFKNYKPFQNYFYGVTGYPGVIIDQRDDLVSVGSFNPSGNGFTERINATAKVGIAAAATLQGNGAVRVEVQLLNKGEANGNYRLAAAVIENDIPYKQADLLNGETQWINDYRHNHVLRAFLTTSYFGDPVGDLAVNGSYDKTFTYTVPSGYKKENMQFVVYVIEASGFANRVAVNSRTVAVGNPVGFYTIQHIKK
ncbi:Omp28-related outer membrane protein [Niabella aquatica]